MDMIFQYEETVRQFVERDGGQFFTLTEDTAFLTNLRAALYKHLGLKGDILRNFNEPAKALKDVRALPKNRGSYIFLIEREYRGLTSLEFIKYLKIDYPDIMVIVLTTEIEREKLILLHELGASNYIIKPISVNTLLEKIASTIRPQTKLGMLIDKGKRHMATGEYEKALKVSLKVLEIKPGSPAGLMLQGDALKNLDKRKDAARAYLEATKEAKLYLEPIKKLAEFFKEEGDMEQELKYLEQLDKLSPLNVERKVDIGGLNIKMGNSDMAKEVFDQAIHLTQRQIAGMLSNVTKYIAEQCMESSPELAEEYLRQSLDAKKDMLTKADVETFNTLGLALRRQGRWEDAVKEYTKALKVAPEDENLHYNMAMAYVDGRSYRQAEAMVDKVLNLNEEFGAESEIVCFNIAYIFLIVKKQKKALEFFQKTLAINPENAEAQKMVKKLMSETNAA